ncbi:hypothetical protein [Methyloceanibacter sp.]|uniref:hypothetical protein n=1 Tax=Methyloceanibacter sp. TaxID=1965321 RepID=UPI003D6CE506
MADKEDSEIPPALREQFRQHFRESIRHESGLDHDEFPLFDWFAKETEGLIASMRQVEESEVRSQVAAGVEQVNDSGLVAVEYFARRTRYSHVIFLASTFESYLTGACSNLALILREDEMPFTLEDLSGDKWTKRRRFLERYGRFQITDQEWRAADQLTRVRNLLVHENGAITALKPKARAELASLPGIKVDTYEIQVEPQFVLETSRALRELIASIQSRIQQVARR